LFQPEILQPSTQLIVACDGCEIRIKTEGLQHARVYPKGNGRIALLDTAESLSRNPGPLRDRFGGICAAQAGLAEPLAEAGNFALEPGEQDWGCT
jgi:hypothetical protein